jgi:hypothetical protein
MSAFKVHWLRMMVNTAFALLELLGYWQCNIEGIMWNPVAVNRINCGT